MSNDRPTRAQVLELLDAEGGEIEAIDFDEIEDVKGLPLSIDTHRATDTFHTPSLEDMGWTLDEWLDPNVQE